MRESRDHTVGVTIERRDDADPPLWPTPGEIAFTTRPGISFTMVWKLDGVHYGRQALGHLGVLLEDMMPSRDTHSYRAAVRVTGCRHRRKLVHGAKLLPPHRIRADVA